MAIETRTSLRILLLAEPWIPVPPRFYGGIERIVDMVARELVRRGHDVTLFSHPASTVACRQIGWNRHEKPSRTSDLRNALQLLRWLGKNRGFDVVHSFARQLYLAPLLRSKTPKIQCYQRAVTPNRIRLGRKIGRQIFFCACSRNMIKNFDDAQSWHVIPNGVDTEWYETNLDVPRNAPLVFLGRIEPIKGPDVAIRIAKKTQRPLVIAGNVEEAHRAFFESEVLRHCDDKIRYIGPVDDTQKRKILANAAALVFPISWEEPFGIVMVEALACGTPVVAFGRGAVPEVIEHGLNGFVVNTEEEMADAIGDLSKLSRHQCRKTAEDRFSAVQISKLYEQLYRKLIGNK